MFPERRISAVVAQGGATNFKLKLMMEAQRPKQKGGHSILITNIQISLQC